MRVEFSRYEGRKLTFTGTVARESRHKYTQKPTLLLVDVCCAEYPDLKTNHVWVLRGKRLGTITPGDIIEFTATIRRYYKMNSLASDFKLNNLGQIRVTGNNPAHTINVAPSQTIIRRRVGCCDLKVTVPESIIIKKTRKIRC